MERKRKKLLVFFRACRLKGGRPDASQQEIMEAARQANAQDFIIRLPQAYNTLVGDRGMTAGERQRIGIARAIVGNPPILILDEPTASLDTESQESVLRALENPMWGRTVITITHRLPGWAWIIPNRW